MNEIVYVVELALETGPAFVGAGMGLAIGWRLGGAVSTIVTHWRPRRPLLPNTKGVLFGICWRRRLISDRWPYGGLPR